MKRIGYPPCLAAAFGAVIMASAWVTGALAVTQKDIDSCISDVLVGRRISSCTALIQSGQWTGKASAPIYMTRGIAYFDKYRQDGSLSGGNLPDGGPLGNALSDIDRAIELDPSLAQAYHERARCYEEKGDRGRARADYDRAITLDPKDQSAYHARGNIRRDAGDAVGAVADYDEALRLDPNDTFTLWDRAKVHAARGETDLEFADYSAIVAIGRDPAVAYAERGRIYVSRGELDRAIAEFDQAIAFSHSGYYYKSRGDVFRAKGDLPRAANDYQAAITYSAVPGAADAYNTGLMATVRTMCRNPANADLKRQCADQLPNLVAQVRVICQRLDASEQAKCISVADGAEFGAPIQAVPQTPTLDKSKLLEFFPAPSTKGSK